MGFEPDFFFHTLNGSNVNNFDFKIHFKIQTCDLIIFLLKTQFYSVCINWLVLQLC